jgi:hypothetical protein
VAGEVRAKVIFVLSFELPERRLSDLRVPESSEIFLV